MIGLGTWIIWLSTICRSPASTDVNHSISYSCHGSIVYIAQLQQHLLTGLIPGLLLFGSIVKWVEETRGAAR